MMRVSEAGSKKRKNHKAKMMVEDRRVTTKNKRLGSNCAVDLGEDRIFLALKSFRTFLIKFFYPLARP